MMDSPARNPSPPPELREHAELLDAERIGNTAFSKHWLFTTLMKLIEEVDRENEEGMNTDLMVDVDEDLQNELCKLWDMSMNAEVSKFLEEFKAADILTGIIEKSQAPRVTEICVGILGNMACDQDVCRRMSEKHKLIEIVLQLLESRDPPTLVETTRLIYSSVSNTARGHWLSAIRRSEEVLGHLLFIFQSSTNCDLLKNTAELVDVLLDLEPDLCVSWATEDFIQALLEATEQIGSNHSDALEVYLHIFQSFSTTEPGVEALVAHLDFIVGKLLKFLNVVCEYEIVGVDRMEGPLTSALSVLSILFSSQVTNQDKHCIQNLCKDEKLMRILLKILEPLYPMLQRYKEDLNSNSNCQEPITASEGQVTNTDQSDTGNSAKSTNGKSVTDKSDSKVETTMEQSDLEEYKQLDVLYEVLSSFLMDYCRHLCKESHNTGESGDTDDRITSQSTDSVSENLEPNESNSCESAPKGSKNDETETKGSDIDEAEPKLDNVCAGESGGSEANVGDGTAENSDAAETLQGNNSKEKATIEDSDNKSNNSGTEKAGSEKEKNDNVADEEKIDDSNKSVNDVEMLCLPVLTYLDEACSRCRINNMALTFMSKTEEGGKELLNQIYEMSQRLDKERLIRILNDVYAGKIVSRAQSGKVLEEQDT